jgi:hypothetical protein
MTMRRSELLALMPKQKDDTQAAYALVRLGGVAVAPVLRDMLLCLRVNDSPVADIFARFFAELLPRPVELIARHIGTRQGFLRERILVDILGEWPREAILSLAPRLLMLATDPGLMNTDVECFRLIVRHELADREWIREWTAFREEQALERARQFEEVNRLCEAVKATAGKAETNRSR